MKLEAALRFYGLPFERHEVSLGTSTEPVRQRAGTHLVPVLETPEGWALWDTTPIMFLLDGRYPERAMFGNDLDGLLVHVVENFLDEWFGRTMVHYRWHYPDCAGIAAALMTGGDADRAADIAAWGLKACRATGVESAHQQAMVEQEYKALLTATEAQLAQTPYLMGDRPSAVDTVVLGGLRAHTMADPVPRRQVAQFPRVVEWADGGADGWDGTGILAPATSPTEFARAMLDMMPKGFFPFILGNRTALVAAEKAFTACVYGEDVSYLARPYPEKACEMVNDHIRRLKNNGKSSDELIAAWGLADIYNAA